MAKVVIDGVSYEVNPNNNLLQECLSQGLDLPYFCWHPCMGSVGACRQKRYVGDGLYDASN
jgi:NADH-quinone oxidoreductase subunit G